MKISNQKILCMFLKEIREILNKFSKIKTLRNILNIFVSSLFYFIPSGQMFSSKMHYSSLSRMIQILIILLMFKSIKKAVPTEFGGSLIILRPIWNLLKSLRRRKLGQLQAPKDYKNIENPRRKIFLKQSLSWISLWSTNIDSFYHRL